MGACNFVGKILFGAALDKFRNYSVSLTTVVLFLNTLSIIGGQFWSTFSGQLVCAVVFGFSIGSYDTSIIVMFKLLTDDITVPLGFSMFVFAVASLVGPTTVGHLYDSTGNLEGCLKRF